MTRLSIPTILLLILSCGANWAQTPKELHPVDEDGFNILMRILEIDPNIPLDPRITEKKENETTIREKIVFRGVQGRLVPAYFEYPKDASGPFPLVLMLHGWSGSKDSWTDENNYHSGGNVRKGLLEKGIAVFAFDSPTHGDRIAENDYAPVNHYPGPEAEGRTNLMTLQEIVLGTVRDAQRGLDYLATRPEVDMDRVGLIGYSMGGWESFPLTAAEPRIKVTAACVTPARMDAYNPIGSEHYIRGIGDRPYAMFMGREDSMCPIDHALGLYDLIPSPQKKLKIYESGHKLPVSYAPEAVDWLTRHLQ
ncbi:MAG: alpha/beta fold hydrolase [Candidatus Omnitrophica bacterium]|nr:alpha/beta fold hydrolase [Candidatus Omnitrophota bacterium]